MNTGEKKSLKSWRLPVYAALAIAGLLAGVVGIARKPGGDLADTRGNDQGAFTANPVAANSSAMNRPRQSAEVSGTTPAPGLAPIIPAQGTRQSESAPGTSALPGAEPLLATVRVPQIPVAKDSQVHLPLAFQSVNPKALTPEGKVKLAQMQQQFVDAIGGDQSSSDPSFPKRWINAPIQADMLYRACFGQTAFQEMQAQRAQGEVVTAQ